MAAEFKIGRLRFTWVGAWQPNTTYARDSVTQYEGKTYVCLVPNTSSTNFYDDLYAVPYPYWNLVVDGKSFVGTWAPSTLLPPLQRVTTFWAPPAGKSNQCLPPRPPPLARRPRWCRPQASLPWALQGVG